MPFVLVHGGYHGPWCWDRLIPELELRGHRSVAVDLPVGDPGAGAAEYVDAIVRVASDLVDVILVGHSMGGLVLPLVPTRYPVTKMVFLCALVPRPGMSMNQVRASEPVENYQLQTSEFTDLGDGVWMIGPNTATELFYHDASPELAAWAIERLRPQAYKLLDELTSLVEWPVVESAFVLCRDDHALNPDWARSVEVELRGDDLGGVGFISPPG